MSLENPCTFLLAKKKTWKCTFSINSKLSQNCTEKQIMLFKTTVNWLFNDMWCYLIIVLFDWKIAVFQQTVVRVYCVSLTIKAVNHDIKSKIKLCRKSYLQYLETSWWFSKLSFPEKRNAVWFLVKKMLYTICLSSCWTT